MTTTTMSGETASAAASPNEAPRVTAWDNIGDDASSNDEPLPPSIPPANRHIAEPLPPSIPPANRHMASPETASAESLPPSIPPQSGGVEGQGQNTDEHVTDPTDIDGKKGTYGLIKSPDGELIPYKVKARSSGSNLPDNIIDTRLAQNAGEQTSADADMSYEDRGRQIIAGATERAKAGGKELFGRAGAGIKRIAGKLVRLARGGVKTVGETAGKGASVVVGFAAIEGPRAAKATAEKASEAREKSAQKIHELAESARSRREERKNKRAAAKAEREREYGERQNARKKKLGEIAARAQEIKDDSEGRSTDIETGKADISDKKAELKRRKVESRAAVSRVRRAERRVRRLDSRVERAQDRRDKAKEISDRNPEDTDAKVALLRAEGKLAAARVRRNAESAVRARLVRQSVDSFGDLTNSRQDLRELQDKVADAKRENVYGRVERLENAGVSAFLRVAEFVDGPTAAHGLLRRAGQAIRRKLQGSGNRQEAKTA